MYILQPKDGFVIPVTYKSQNELYQNIEYQDYDNIVRNKSIDKDIDSSDELVSQEKVYDHLNFNCSDSDENDISSNYEEDRNLFLNRIVKEVSQDNIGKLKLDAEVYQDSTLEDKKDTEVHSNKEDLSEVKRTNKSSDEEAISENSDKKTIEAEAEKIENNKEV